MIRIFIPFFCLILVNAYIFFGVSRQVLIKRSLSFFRFCSCDFRTLDFFDHNVCVLKTGSFSTWDAYLTSTWKN